MPNSSLIAFKMNNSSREPKGGARVPLFSFSWTADVPIQGPLLPEKRKLEKWSPKQDTMEQASLQNDEHPPSHLVDAGQKASGLDINYYTTNNELPTRTWRNMY